MQKFNQFRAKLEQAFAKFKEELKPVGDRYKKYGETISKVGVEGLRQFAKDNVEIFSEYHH